MASFGNTIVAFLIFGSQAAMVVLYFFPEFYAVGELPKMKDEYFGISKLSSSSKIPIDSSKIEKFQINISDSVLHELNWRLNNTRFVESFDNIGFQYGFNTAALKKTTSYWLNKFNWRKQEKKLNQFHQYKSQIEGLDIHFIHEKPVTKNRKLKTYPLLLIHSFPLSNIEFLKMIPLLTIPNKDLAFLFEIISPSIPGFGFSEAPHKPGFNAISAARIFMKLMDRLGFEKFYVHGGNCGSMIASTMALYYPNRILGVHLTTFFVKAGFFNWIEYAVGSYFPSHIMDDFEAKKIYPFTDYISRVLKQSAYAFKQITGPDTLGISLNESPSGLAAYILDIILLKTDPSFRQLQDGGLSKKFSLDELLTNIMIYWATDSITPSMRFYKDTFSIFPDLWNLMNFPIKVPVGIAAFPHNDFLLPKFLIQSNLPNLTHYTQMPRGGHFSAIEEPILLSADIVNFVKNNTRN